MNLSVQLSELLKTNDCVIIPDLGGFIANYQISGYDEQTDQFTPPIKEIIFSGKLKKNDGLLVNYISDRDGIGYLEARKIVSEFVAESIFRLENGERIILEQIGTLRFDQNEHLIFEQEKTKIIRTDAFGLDSFHFPRLVNKYNHPPKPVLRDKDPEPQKHLHPALKYVLIGIPLVVALYFIPYNKLFDQSKLVHLQTSNTASLPINDTKLINKVEAVKNTTELNAAASRVGSIPAHASTVAQQPEKTVAQQLEKPIAQTVVNDSPSGKYHVVAGCFKVRENADNLAGKLIKQGYPAQVSNLGKYFFRVSVQSFQTKKEAEVALVQLANSDPETGYWLMADKK
ncbi:MAG TPA: SPOR domain-containing protein [Prolixibacteraceae bacterium]